MQMRKFSHLVWQGHSKMGSDRGCAKNKYIVANTLGCNTIMHFLTAVAKTANEKTYNRHGYNNEVTMVARNSQNLFPLYPVLDAKVPCDVSTSQKSCQE